MVRHNNMRLALLIKTPRDNLLHNNYFQKLLLGG